MKDKDSKDSGQSVDADGAEAPRTGNIGRRGFASRAAVLLGVSGVSSANTACLFVDSDTGDPVRSDSDVTSADQDPNDPVSYGDPSGARTDSDTGD